MAGRVDQSVWDERREWIRKQQASGLSMTQFCREHGLNLANFHSWRERFAKLDAQQANGSGKPTGGPAPRQAFVQLPLPTVAVQSNSWIEISLADGIIVRLPASNLAALDLVLSRLNATPQETRHA
jgi:hypothetical protein